jgi:hypothetical protein
MNMFDKLSNRALIAADVLALAGSVSAQDLQQAQAECQSIARQQTGYNPGAASAATTTQPQAGGRARAANGRSKANEYERVPDEVAEEYTRNQMEDAAKAGAAVAAARQRQQRRQSVRAQQQQSAAANAYDQAYASYMAAKGFPGQ